LVDLDGAFAADRCKQIDRFKMLKTRILATVAIFALTASTAVACTAEDVQAKQGALITAVTNLMAVDPAKAQAIVAQMQTELEAAAASGDETAVCGMMDRLTAEAAG
jgi:hypothetical protein